MIWCFTRILVRSGSGRQRYSVLGAIETRDHDLVTIRTSGSVNAETTLCKLVQEIRRRYGGKPVTLVMDNAAFLRSHFHIKLSPIKKLFIRSTGFRRDKLRSCPLVCLVKYVNRFPNIVKIAALQLNFDLNELDIMIIFFLRNRLVFYKTID